MDQDNSSQAATPQKNSIVKRSTSSIDALKSFCAISSFVVKTDKYFSLSVLHVFLKQPSAKHSDDEWHPTSFSVSNSTLVDVCPIIFSSSEVSAPSAAKTEPLFSDILFRFMAHRSESRWLAPFLFRLYTREVCIFSGHSSKYSELVLSSSARLWLI